MADTKDKAWVALAHGAAPVAVGGVANIGGHCSVHLPSEETQRKGFSLKPEQAKALLAQYPDRYKVQRKISGGPKQAAHSKEEEVTE